MGPYNDKVGAVKSGGIIHNHPFAIYLCLQKAGA
jgi:hypothetical protein